MKVAVVGSGIAGLSAAWLLSQVHEVSLFERSGRLGMDAHGLDIACSGGEVRVDVPLRVFFDGFYPNLSALYEVLGVESEAINYSASFGLLGEGSYFRYDNFRLGGYALPFLKGLDSIRPRSLRIGWDVLRFFRQIPEILAQGLSDDLVLAEFVEQKKFSKAFAEGFLYPAFAGICTCTHERVRRYPARIILEYLHTGLLLSSMRRVTQGTQEVVQRLSRDIPHIHLDTPVREVSTGAGGALVVTDAGAQRFDHVVLATQANQSADLLKSATAEEQAVLAAFSYEPSRVVVHRDERLAPPGGERHWAPVNFLLDAPGTTPMATIWLNAIQSMPDTGPVFQTWNPLVEPDPDQVLAQSRFERPVVSARSLEGLRQLGQLHKQSERRIWFCGSYAARGIPLLESATHSALGVAELLGCRRPWGEA